MSVFAKLPDGRRLKFPDGTSQEVIDRAVQSELGVKSAAATPAAPDPFGGSLAMGLDAAKAGEAFDPMAQTLKEAPGRALAGAAGIAKGMVDLPLGGAQMLANLPLMPAGAKTAIDNYMRLRDKSYKDAFGDKSDSVEIGRVAGNIETALPFAAKAAPTLLGRMLQGAKISGTLASLMPVNPDSQNYWGNKVGQVAPAVVLGALAPPVMEGIFRGASAVVNKLKDVSVGAGARISGAITDDAVENALKIELQSNGIDWQTLGKEARAALVSESQAALKAGKQLDPKAIARIADFKTVGVEPLKGQIFRDPSQFRFEQNMAKTEMGAPLAERLGQQNQALIGAVERVRSGTGGAGTDPYAAGERVISGLRAVDAPRKAAVTAAYTEARNMAGEGAKVPMQPIAQKLGQVVEEFGETKVPADVMKRAKDFGLLGGTQTRDFTVAEAERFRKLIGNNINPADASQAQAMGLLRGSVDDAVGLLATKGDEIGSAAAAQFGKARGMAAERFATIEKTPALSAVLDKTKTLAPEKFVDQFVLRGSVDDLANLSKQLKDSPQAMNEARASVVEWLKRKAIGSGSEEMAQFSQAGYNRALQTIGDRKLALLFSQEEQQALKAVGRVAEAIQKAPTATGINYSSTATTLIDMLDKVARVPVVGPLLGRPGDMLRASQVQQSLMASPARSAPMLTQEQIDRLAPYVGLLGAPAAGVGGGLLAR